MIFGLAVELFLLVLLGWGITSAYQRFGPSSARRNPEVPPMRRQNLLDGPVERSVTEEVDARHQVTPPPPQISAKALREKRMAELQRLYVADEITVEQYEKELDALLREETGKPE